MDSFMNAKSFLGIENDADNDANVALTELDKGDCSSPEAPCVQSVL
jgi:hypothetical protein